MSTTNNESNHETSNTHVSREEKQMTKAKTSVKGTRARKASANFFGVPRAHQTRNDLIKPRRVPQGKGLVSDKSATIANSLAILAQREMPSEKVFTPNVISSGSPSNTVEGPASIAELARALKNNPDLIFAWVYQNIEYVPTFGEAKGALGCLIDGSGNSFDQAALLAALFNAAGLTASLEFGNIQLTGAQAAAWLGTDPSNVAYAYSLLYNGGVPVQYTSDSTGIILAHLWVKVTISGTAYVFDPSYKAYTSTAAAVNLATATGYTQSGLLSQAAVGATIDPNGVFVQNLNRANIRSQLATYSNNLVSYLKANDPTANLDAVIGGRTINAVTAPVRQTSLPYQQSGNTPVNWTSVPNNYRVTFNVIYSNINMTFYGPDVHGQRLTLFSDASNNITMLSLNGTLLATASSTSTYIQIIINHPYTNVNANENLYQTIEPSGGSSNWSYLIGVCFGPAGKGLVDYWQAQLTQYQAAGMAYNSEPVLGTQMAIDFYTYVSSLMKAQDVNCRIGSCVPIHHHINGLVYWWMNPAFPTGQGYTQMDVASIETFINPLSASANYTTVSSVAGELSHATETIALRQLTGVEAAGPTRVMDVANQDGIEIIMLTPANQNTTLPMLSGYQYSIPYIQSALNSGYTVYAPMTAPETMENESVEGYTYVFDGGGIAGNFYATKGGGTTQPSQPLKGKQPNKNPNDPKNAEPIDVRTGDYLYEQTDISIGSGDVPYNLLFKSMYDSRLATASSALGFGWKHNWLCTASVGSDSFKALGQDSPLEAATSIVSFFILQDLFSDSTYPVEKMVVGFTTTMWYSDTQVNNTVTVSLPDGDYEFTLLQDGTYNPPLNYAHVLSLNGGLYSMTTPQKLKYNFNSSGQLSTIVYPYGVTVTLNYTSGNLSSISNGMGRQLTVGYTGNFISSVTDGTGRSVAYSVNATSQQLTSITDTMTKATTFSYNANNRLTSLYKPQNPTNAVVTNTYDTLGRVSSQKDAIGNVWSIYLAGSRSEFDDPAGNSQVTYFDSHGFVTQTVDALGNVTTYGRDVRGRLALLTYPEGNARAFAYDLFNNVLSTTDTAKPGSPLAAIVNSFTYDSTYNKVHTAKDGRGNTTTYNYDSATGNLLNVQRPAVSGSTPTLTYTYNGRGQVLTLTDETSIVTKFTYDTTTEKLLTRTVDSGTGTHLNLLTSFGYDAVGNVNSVTDPNTYVWTSIFDNKRRLIQTTSPSPFSYVSKFTYDANDNRTQVQRQTGGTPAWQTYTYTYTLADQLYQAMDPASNTTTYTYNNLRLVSKIVDAQSRTTQYAYDARWKVYTVTDATSTICDTRLYTNNGMLASRKDARSNVTSCSYDGFDRLFKTTYADGTFESNSSYDANNNILTQTTRSTSTITNTYDVLNRRATKAPTGQATVTYTYDLHGRLTKVSTPVVSGNPATGAYQYAFDAAGRYYQETTPDSKVTTLGLDANGNVTKLTYPDGYYVTRVYDQMSRLTNLKLNGATASAATIAYDQLSRRQSLTLGNGVVINYTFQINNDLTTLAEAYVGSSLSITLGYNNVHEITSQAVSDSGFMWHPATAGTTSYGVATNVNAYPTVGGTTYSYDGNKNLTGDGTWTYTYDTENHLLTASKSGTSASFVYDGMHRQIQKTVGTTQTRYAYGGNQMIAEYNGVSGALTNRYVTSDTPDEVLMRVTSGGTLTYFHHNHQKSVIALSSASGAITNKVSYGPFGESSTLGTLSSFGFTGQRFDSETGLCFYKMRYYSPALGRFLQTDPGSYIDGLNLYRYVNNNPLSINDPSGKSGLYLNQQSYLTLNDAVTAALGQATLNSLNGNEWGGYIIKNPDGTYSYTVPFQGSSTDPEGVGISNAVGFHPTSDLESIQGQAEGTYHSHPVGDDKPYEFSASDKENANSPDNFHLPWYWSDPDFGIYKWNPIDNKNGWNTTILEPGSLIPFIMLKNNKGNNGDK